MFNNRPGNQLKRYASIVFVLRFAFFTIIGAIILVYTHMHLYNTVYAPLGYIIGVAIILFGDYSAWSSTIMMYSFGTLVDATEDIRDLLESVHRFNR